MILMAESDRLAGRNGRWWREYCSGRTMEFLAERDGVSVATVSLGIKAVRDSIPEETREQEVQRSLEMLHDLRADVLEIYRLAPAPVFVGKDGDPARDPDTGEYVRDHGGRLRAAETVLKVDKSIRDLLGLDAAAKLDIGVSQSEERAAEQIAKDAWERLQGEAKFLGETP